MKKVLFIWLFVLYCTPFKAIDPNRTITCKVIEWVKNKKVDVEFSPNVEWLGEDYENTVLYVNNKRLKFADGNAAVNYLCDSWGWRTKGKPIQLLDGSSMWTLYYDIYQSNEPKKRPVNRQAEVYNYYDDDGDSH